MKESIQRRARTDARRQNQHTSAPFWVWRSSLSPTTFFASPVEPRIMGITRRWEGSYWYWVSHTSDVIRVQLGSIFSEWLVEVACLCWLRQCRPGEAGEVELVDTGFDHLEVCIGGRLPETSICSAVANRLRLVPGRYIIEILETWEIEQ